MVEFTRDSASVWLQIQMPKLKIFWAWILQNYSFYRDLAW